MSKNIADQIVKFKQLQGCNLPDTTIARKFAHHLFETLFICKCFDDNITQKVQAQLVRSQGNLLDLLDTVYHNYKIAQAQTDLFFSALPQIYNDLQEDAKAIYNADPAAKTLGQVVLAYPGFFTVAIYRFAHQLHKQKIDLIPRILSEYAHSRTGIDIHPGASIGHSFAIDHGTGIVIGETAIIGNHVKVYQGVTLGALSVAKDKASQKRHPTIQDNVVIYAGATILGGDTVVGHDSIIGGNVWLTNSVDAYSVVYHQSEIKVQDKKQFEQPYNFVI